MGLYLLNVSVDVVDPNPEYIPENLAVNDQESIIEIVFEKVFGFENFIEEYDDHDSEDQNKKKNVKIDVFDHQITTDEKHHHIQMEKKKAYPNTDTRLIIAFLEIDSPPPKA